MNERHSDPLFEPTPRELRRLLALVDESPPDGAGAGADAGLSPAAQRALAANRRVAQVLSAGGPSLSPALCARLEALMAARTTQSSTRRARAALVAGVAALVLTFAAIAPGLLRGGPHVDEVVALGPLPAERPAPAPARDEPAMLARAVDGVAFPDWRVLGWNPAGSRSDDIDGRAAETVFYVHEGHRVAYTILAGDAIRPPADARSMTIDGTRLAALRSGGRDIVVFQRGGHTCVLSGHVLRTNTLTTLATWQAGDAIVEF